LRARVDIQLAVARQSLEVEVVVLGDLVRLALPEERGALLDRWPHARLAARHARRDQRDQTTSDPTTHQRSIMNIHVGLLETAAGSPGVRPSVNAERLYVRAIRLAIIGAPTSRMASSNRGAIVRYTRAAGMRTPTL